MDPVPDLIQILNVYNRLIDPRTSREAVSHSDVTRLSSAMSEIFKKMMCIYRVMFSKLLTDDNRSVLCDLDNLPVSNETFNDDRWHRRRESIEIVSHLCFLAKHLLHIQSTVSCIQSYCLSRYNSNMKRALFEMNVLSLIFHSPRPSKSPVLCLICCIFKKVLFSIIKLYNKIKKVVCCL